MKKQMANAISLAGIIISLTNFALFFQKLISFEVWLVLFNLGIVIDLLDGFVARKYGLVTKLGSWLDTAHDIILYLITPLLWIKLDGIIWEYSIILISGLYRLFRFSHTGLVYKGGDKYYVGLPVYFNLISILIYIIDNKINYNLPIIFGCFAVAISYLMSSKILINKWNLKTSAAYLVLFNIVIYVIVKY